MRKKLFVSAGAVIGLSFLSIVAFASSSGNVDTEEVVSMVPMPIDITDAAIVYTDEMPVTTAPIFDDDLEYESRISSMDWDGYESYLLAKLAMAEAEGEDTEGKALVILVALNRVWSDDFPNSIEEVIYQDGQFSPVQNGRFEMVEPDRDCWQALDMVMRDKWDESHGALYFESESDSTWHRDHLQFLFQHGAHRFYTDKEA